MWETRGRWAAFVWKVGLQGHVGGNETENDREDDEDVGGGRVIVGHCCSCSLVYVVA